MEANSRIVLTRSSEWMNRARSFGVYIDDQKVGTIRNGGTEEFRVTPGHHKVVCKIDWCSSREFEIDAKQDEAVYLHVKNGIKYYWLFVAPLLAVLVVNLYFKLNPEGRPAWLDYMLIVAGIPALIYIVYYLTFGRKDYLVVGADTRTLFGK